MEVDNVAVIMSVYRNDKLVYVQQAVESILNQSHASLVFFIYKDGGLSSDTDAYLNHIQSTFHNVRLFSGSKNQGLAYALNFLIDIALKECRFSYIFRMDADDISHPERIKKQIDFMNENSSISILGTDVIEIDGDGSQIFYKCMPAEHTEIVKGVVKKCPLNHPTVCFRTSFFQDGMRYNVSLKNTQDYYLWVDAISKGMVIGNLNLPLLHFRVDDDFYSRRGFDKLVNDLGSRWYAINKLGLYSFSSFFHMFCLCILRLSPSVVRKWVYKNFR
ncbi:glycosyltransferase [Shewanella algae]|uniref:glycosyltransferase n=1 Tax=Shewanella algae TaxID=38313 RepID=UPI001AAF8BEE|nr:glycosyltransferase [Shewanella algae]MBO2590373.1 glycosyltransferase [Shewanella algae]